MPRARGQYFVNNDNYTYNFKSFFYVLEAFCFSIPGNHTLINLILLFSEILIIGIGIIIIIVEITMAILRKFNSKINKFPKFFSVKTESYLDIFFLLFPTIIVIIMLTPTLGQLYASELDAEYINNESGLTLSIVAHQWYWSYKYDLDGSASRVLLLPWFNDTQIEELDSAPFPDDLLTSGRALEVTNAILFPLRTYVVLSITSDDVVHSWAIPQLGLKIDAVPGRVAYALLYSNIIGRWIGQCSELCGDFHAFMPIVLECTTINKFWASMYGPGNYWNKKKLFE